MISKQYEMTCPICMQEMLSDCMCELPCKHIFHTTCVFKWVSENKNTCPMCRKCFMEKKSISNEIILNLQNHIYMTRHNMHIAENTRLITIRLLSSELVKQKKELQELRAQRRQERIQRHRSNQISMIFRKFMVLLARGDVVSD